MPPHARSHAQATTLSQPIACVLPQRTHLSTRPASQFLSEPSPISQSLSSDIDIHSLIASYEHEPRKKVLSAFYIARATLVEYDVEGTPKLATPSLLAEALSGRASIFALFGAQGINLFDELQTLFDTYRLVEPFLAFIIDEVLQPLASASHLFLRARPERHFVAYRGGSTPPS